MFVPDHLHSVRLFYSPLVTISDWCCRPAETAFGAEEESSGHLLVFPRTGLFVERRARHGDIVGDPTRVHFFNRSEPYRVAHPVSGGDDCTSIRFDDQALVEFLRHDDPSNEDTLSPFRLPAVGSTHAMML